MKKNLSIQWGHDSSLCLATNKEILGFIELERISRIKSYSFKNIWKYDQGNKEFEEIVFKFLDNFQCNINDIDKITLTRTARGDEIPNPIKKLFKNQKYFFFDHHEAHAAVGYYSSPFNKSIIMTMDGGGNDGGLGFWIGEDNKVKKIKTEGDGSIGQTWTALRRYWSKTKLGPISTEGTLMGASAKGKVIPELKELFLQTMENGEKVWSSFPKVIESLFKKRFFIRQPKYFINEQTYFDFCASLQSSFNLIFEKNLRIAQKYMLKYDTDAIVLSGGSIYNCVAVGNYIPKYFKKYYIPYSIDDGGLAIGCNLLLNHKINNEPKNDEYLHNLNSPYQGFDYKENQILNSIKSYKKIKFKNINEIEVAKLISEGKIIGIFNGRSESGKRALGNRSIVADPRNSNMKNILNIKIKNRQTYRPFAPTILEEFTSEYFENNITSPFMNFSVQVKKDKRNLIPAACHIDNSSRVQTLSRKFNPSFYKLIEEFYKITNVPVLINTSFNESEPIVENINDAIKTFLETDIDYLYVFEKYLILKI